MRLFITLLFALASFALSAQISFTEATLENGMTYPVVHLKNRDSVADTMNSIILANLIEEKASDFCIGDFGYYQKGNHLEIHLVANCMDFEETKHSYLFFSLESGRLVEFPDLFDPKKKEETLRYLNETIRKSQPANACAADFGDMTSDLNWNSIGFHLYKDGIELRPTGNDCASPIHVPWTEISSFLKYSYL